MDGVAVEDEEEEKGEEEEAEEEEEEDSRAEIHFGGDGVRRVHCHVGPDFVVIE